MREKPIPYGLSSQGLRLRPWQATLLLVGGLYWVTRKPETVGGAYYEHMVPHGNPRHTKVDCDRAQGEWIRWHLAIEKRARETGLPQSLANQPKTCAEYTRPIRK
jgi:hypothetical protein